MSAPGCAPSMLLLWLLPPQKNSLCVHTSSDLAPPETRVIMEDLNPQCSLGSRYSISGGVKPSFLQATYQIYQVFVGESFFFFSGSGSDMS